MAAAFPHVGVVHIALPASYLGTQLDRRYRLDRFIGEGASAWVFAAQDLRLERDVAIKLLKPRGADEQGGQRRRFVAEGRTLAKLVHPHIVLVHDAGETADGLGYLVMELSDSGSLEGELFRRKTLPVEEALALLLPVMGALACAHDRDIVHRDIKPANIALVRERGETRAKLLDFGIAKRQDAAASTDSALGTPSYMAPEQARGEALSPAADVWALGVVFFRCLTGRVPFDARSSLEALLQLVQKRAPLFSEACPSLGPHLAIALDRALEPDPQRRYADMRSFARALAAACAQDGIRLPRRPEPVGLPDFERWVSSADVESTQPLLGDEREQIAVAPARPLPRPYAARKHKIWILAAALVCGAGVGVALSLSGSDKLANETRALAEHVKMPRSAAVAQPKAPALPPILPEQRAVAASPASAEPLPPTMTPSRRKRQIKAKAAIGPTLTPSAHEDGSSPAASPAAKPGLITTWDW